MRVCRAASRKQKAAGGARGGGAALQGGEAGEQDATLRLQVEALRAQLEEQTRVAREQLDALLHDRQVSADETQARQQRDLGKIQTLTEKYAAHGGGEGGASDRSAVAPTVGSVPRRIVF